MPADRLNLTHLETAVLSVLTGQPPDPIAARLGLRTAELTDAAEAFHNAGRAALQHRADGRWQAYVEFPDWTTAAATAATHLAPPLERTGAPWSFIRKHPHWRLRLHTGDADHHHLATALDALLAAGHIRRWHPGIYEPETAAFGGPTAMDAVHALFHTDSRSILTLPPTPALGRRELSILLCTCLLRGAGLEWYEQGDVWQRVTTDRPPAQRRDGTPTEIPDREHLGTADRRPPPHRRPPRPRPPRRTRLGLGGRLPGHRPDPRHRVTRRNAQPGTTPGPRLHRDLPLEPARPLRTNPKPPGPRSAHRSPRSLIGADQPASSGESHTASAGTARSARASRCASSGLTAPIEIVNPVRRQVGQGAVIDRSSSASPSRSA